MNLPPVIGKARKGDGATKFAGNPRHPGISRRSRTKAFSLVEIVLAIGIVSFAFVAIFGLLPVGMTTFRQAMDTSVSSQIVQRVVNEAQQTDFATLIASQGPLDRFFDDQGNEVSQANSIYTVRTTVKSPTEPPNVVTSTSLATVKVEIASFPGQNAFAVSGSTNRPVSTYSALIAKNGQ